MTTPRSFLNVPYGAYLAREVPAPDDELTQRRARHAVRRIPAPFLAARRLRARSRAVPLRVAILGEDLVVFRDQSGRVGVLQLPLRASRHVARVRAHRSSAGIRCCYHGWVFDVDGRILETPGEPREQPLRDRLCQGAYPTHEFAGLVFAYMGPPERRPAFPVYDTLELPGHTLDAGGEASRCRATGSRSRTTAWIRCTRRSSTRSEQRRTVHRGVRRRSPELDWRETPIGMIYIATRRVGDLVWVRVCDFMPPNVHQFTREIEEATEEKTASRPVIIRWAVPIDDTHTT